MILDIVVYNIESALKAQEGAADRIELCDNPGEGGTTPSFGIIESVRQNVNLDVYVMIRPRGGDFHYTNYEFHSMKRDIYQCQRITVDGIVFGILNADGTLDKKRCKELIDKARPLKVTCHRAFDMTRDPFEASRVTSFRPDIAGRCTSTTRQSAGAARVSSSRASALA